MILDSVAISDLPELESDELMTDAVSFVQTSATVAEAAAALSVDAAGRGGTGPRKVRLCECVCECVCVVRGYG